MKRLIILLTLTVTIIAATAQTNDDAIVDSLRREVKKMPHGKERLTKISELVSVSQLQPEGVNDAMMLLDEAKLQKVDTLQAMALTFIVNHHYMYDDRLDSVVYWANYGMKVARKCNEWKMFFEMQYTLVNTYVYNERFEYALDEADNMLVLAKKQGYKEGMVKAYISMSLAYTGTRRWHEADKALKNAHKLMYQSKDLSMQFTVLMQILNYYITIDKYGMMKDILSEIDALVVKMIKEIPGMEITLNDHRLFVEYCHILYWSSIKDFTKAKEHEKLAKLYYSKLSYPNYKPLLINAQCYMLMKMGKYDEALELNDKAIQMAKKTQVMKIVNYMQCLRQRADILYESKQYGKALDIYKKVDFMTDSINNSISEKQIEELSNISRLNTMKAEAERLRGNRILSIAIIMIVVSLLLVVILTRLFLSSIKLKKARANTQKALAEAEEHNRQKDSFFSNMSHAIRTPLNTVVGFSTSLAHDTQLTMEERTQFADIIRKDTELLMYLVNGVLDFSRLEAGMTKWQISRCDIIKICREAIDAAALKWPEANFSIHGNLKPFIINTDAGRMRQVIDSMLTGTVGVNKVEGDVIIYSNVINNEMSLRVVNSPLSLPNPSNEAIQLRHDINRLTLEFFKGKYCQNPISIILRRQSV
ncbi:MAG: histidine kinase dimerization/phospho-acceptor domain-containing protein [Prevotella sp.]